MLKSVAYLRLHGSNAKAHPVFRELTRVKQYFEKIKIAESKDQGRTGPTIDKPAAGRFIKHALVIARLILKLICADPQPQAANNILDARKSQHHTAEKSHIRFDQTSNQLGAVDMVQSVVNTKGLSSICSSGNAQMLEKTNYFRERWVTYH